MDLATIYYLILLDDDNCSKKSNEFGTEVSEKGNDANYKPQMHVFQERKGALPREHVRQQKLFRIKFLNITLHRPNGG